MPEHIEIWERRRDESDPAWEAFETYRDLKPSDRSVSEVARRLAKSRTLASRWAAKYAWTARAVAFDRNSDKVWISEAMRLKRETAERDTRIAGAMLQKVVARLQSLDPSQLSARDCATWVDVATKVNRLALDLPTDKHELSGPGGGPIAIESLTPEERRARLEQLTKEVGRRLKAIP